MSWDDEDADWDAGVKNDNDNDNSGGAPLTDKWAGEDASDDDTLLGDDWDAEPEEKKKPVAPVKKALTKRQIAKKREEEERQAAIKRREAAKASKGADPMDKAAIKKAIDDSNNMLCDDLFGGDGFEAPEGGEFKNEQLESDNLDMVVDLKNLKLADVRKKEKLEDDPLKTKADFKKFAEKVSKMVNDKGEKNQKYILEFLNTVINQTTSKMKLDDVNLAKKTLNVICTKKQKEESNKKKKGNKKAQLTMSRGNDDMFDDGGNYDDGLDDFF